jgi:hypothetical protein
MGGKKTRSCVRVLTLLAYCILKKLLDNIILSEPLWQTYQTWVISRWESNALITEKNPKKVRTSGFVFLRLHAFLCTLYTYTASSPFVSWPPTGRNRRDPSTEIFICISVYFIWIASSLLFHHPLPLPPPPQIGRNGKRSSRRDVCLGIWGLWQPAHSVETGSAAVPRTLLGYCFSHCLPPRSIFVAWLCDSWQGIERGNIALVQSGT